MDPLVAGCHDAAAGIGRFSLPARDHSTRTLNDGHEREHIIGLELGLDDEVDVAGRQHAVGVAIAAVARESDAAFDLRKLRAIARIHQERAGREQHCFRQRGAGADAQVAFACGPAVVRPPSVAAEALADEGLVHHAEDRLARPQQGDERAPCRHPGNKRLGPVDGVEHPHIFRIGALAAEFLSDDPVIGKGAVDEIAHGRLGSVVGRGDGIKGARAPFVGNAERGSEERQDRLAGEVRELVNKNRKINCRHLAPKRRHRRPGSARSRFPPGWQP